jgi:hypothetical protein
MIMMVRLMAIPVHILKRKLVGAQAMPHHESQKFANFA